MSDNHLDARLRCLSTQAASAVTQTLLWRKINFCVLLFLFPLCRCKSHLRLALILRHIAETRGRDASQQAAFNYAAINWHLPGLSHSIWSPIKGMIYGLKRGWPSCLAAWLFGEETNSETAIRNWGSKSLEVNFTRWLISPKHRVRKLQNVLLEYNLPSRQNRCVDQCVLTGWEKVFLPASWEMTQSGLVFCMQNFKGHPLCSQTCSVWGEQTPAVRHALSIRVGAQVPGLTPAGFFYWTYNSPLFLFYYYYYFPVHINWGVVEKGFKRP